MAPKQIPTRREDRSLAQNYLRKADELRRSARDNLTNRRWNAACFDAIHAGINCADAVLVFRHGLVSTSPHHPDVIELLRRHLDREADAPCGTLSRLIARKHVVEYESRLATEREASDAVDRADELFLWAKDRVKPAIP
jgi:HEPN domain-containing protein